VGNDSCKLVFFFIRRYDRCSCIHSSLVIMIASYTSQNSSRVRSWSIEIDTTSMHVMYDLETVQEVIWQRLVHAVHGMQDQQAHERDVDVLVELFHVGQASISLLPCFSEQDSLRCYVMQSSLLLSREALSRRFTLTASVTSGGASGIVGPFRQTPVELPR